MAEWEKDELQEIWSFYCVALNHFALQRHSLKH